MAEKKKGVGAPTKYDPSYARIAQKMCELGATDADLADALGVHLATLYRWKSSNREFCDAIKIGKEIPDDNVEMSLYRKALGYHIDTVKVFNNQGEALIVPVKEYYPPDTGAIVFYLKNRRPEKWRDKQADEVAQEQKPIEIRIVKAKRDGD
ncbi:MAG: hypothetical protein ACRCXB_26845 [Aeromonadaceae bacterium]